MKKIFLSGKVGVGKFALVDNDDYDYLINWKWIFQNGYARRTGANNRSILMHSLINKTPSGMFTDHINGSRLDNRKNNLRTTTNSQNQMNRTSNKDSTSKYKGVSWDNSSKKWKSQIRINSKKICLGFFEKEKDAAISYDSAAIKHHKEFAKPNLKRRKT